MTEKTPSPVKRGDGNPAARGGKAGPVVDPRSDTLQGLAAAASLGSAESAGDTQPRYGEGTLKPQHSGGATMVPDDAAPVLAVRPPVLDQTLAAKPIGPNDQTIQASPDKTMGGHDAGTQAFHKAALAAAPKSVAAGQTFGHYELIEPIAKGGMGIVYKARQKKLNRIVAIKMILAGQFADQSDIDRFYAEAEAAAALSHPNIVAIHEIGEMNGQHFFSMDFIEGKSLSGLIQENPVPPRVAAEFTKTIAETMEFAHEKGVVHRDLKPANVLLDKRQRPLITDFGLAKQVSNTSQLTMAGSIVGTPSYMPPEQAAGKIEEIGPWSDLYSIGAILYELLTGRPPFRASNPFETVRQVIELEPPSPRLLNANVPKDLETICLKCLQKERIRRYANCQELADELGRYLRGEPIQARPISGVARFWRLCKRYPATASAIAIAVVALLSASIFSTAAYFRTKRALANETAALSKSENSLRQESAAKALAEERKAQADQSFREAMQAVNDLLTKVSESRLRNQPGAQELRQELLVTARGYHERFQQQRQGDPDVENELAASHFRVGRIALDLGALDDAIKSLSKAQEMQTRLLAEKPNDLDRLKALGDSLTQLGQVWTRKRDLAAASRDYAEAVRIREQLIANAPENHEFQRVLASAYMNAGLVAFNMAQAESDDKAFNALLAKAQDQFDKMQAIRTRLLTIPDLDEKFRRDVKRDFGIGCFNLGRLAQEADRLNVAIDHFKNAATAFEEVLEDEPNDLDNQGRLATCRRLVGDLLKASGEPAEARDSYERALIRLGTLVKENPDVAEYQYLQAGLLLNLFTLEKDANNASAARAAVEKARQIYADLAEKHPSVAVYQRDLAVTLRELAKEKDAAGEQQAAAADLAEAIRLLTELVEDFPNQPDYAQRLKETKEVVLASVKPNN